MKEETKLPRSTQMKIGKSANNFNDKIKIIIKEYAENFEQEIQEDWDSERRYLMGVSYKDALKAEIKEKITQAISDYLKDLETNFKVSYKGAELKFSLNSKGEKEFTNELWEKIAAKRDTTNKDTGELGDIGNKVIETLKEIEKKLVSTETELGKDIDDCLNQLEKDLQTESSKTLDKTKYCGKITACVAGALTALAAVALLVAAILVPLLVPFSIPVAVGLLAATVVTGLGMGATLGAGIVAAGVYSPDIDKITVGEIVAKAVDKDTVNKHIGELELLSDKFSNAASILKSEPTKSPGRV